MKIVRKGWKKQILAKFSQEILSSVSCQDLVSKSHNSWNSWQDLVFLGFPWQEFHFSRKTRLCKILQEVWSQTRSCMVILQDSKHWGSSILCCQQHMFSDKSSFAGSCNNNWSIFLELVVHLNGLILVLPKIRVLGSWGLRLANIRNGRTLALLFWGSCSFRPLRLFTFLKVRSVQQSEDCQYNTLQYRRSGGFAATLHPRDQSWNFSLSPNCES